MSEWKDRIGPVFALATLLAIVGVQTARCASDTLDFAIWSKRDGEVLPNGWREAGMGQYTSDSLAGAAYFSGEGDCVSSPIFPADIRSVSIDSATLQTNLTRQVTLAAYADDVEKMSFTIVSPTNKNFETQVYDLAALGVNRFVLTSGRGSGNWAVRKIVVLYGRYEQEDMPAWRLSSFLPNPGERVADFSGIGVLPSATGWRNGVDGDFFYAFKDTNAVDIIRPATKSSVNADLYCFQAGVENARTNGLALLGSRSTGLRLILPVRLDAARIVESLSAVYEVREVKAGAENVVTRMSFAWSTGDQIEGMEGPDMIWRECEVGCYSTGESDGRKNFALPVGEFGAQPYLFLKWSVPKQANSAMLGLTNVRLSGTLRKMGLSVYFQ